MNELNWISIEKRLPESGRLVYTKDAQGNISAYTRYGDGWNSLIDTSNSPIVAWLDRPAPLDLCLQKRLN